MPIEEEFDALRDSTGSKRHTTSEVVSRNDKETLILSKSYDNTDNLIHSHQPSMIVPSRKKKRDDGGHVILMNIISNEDK